MVFIGMILDGNTILLIIGFLLNTGEKSAPIILILIAFLGAIIENIIWYQIGAKMKNHNSKIAKWIVEKTDNFDEHLVKRPMATMLISKFIYGVHRAAIARAGILGDGVKNYLEQIIPVILLWMGIFLSTGFVLGAAFSFAKEYIGYAEFGLLGIFVLLIIINRFIVSKKLERKI